MTTPDTAAAFSLRAYRYALDPTSAQRITLARHVGAARWAFNHALGRKVAAHEQWRQAVEQLVEAGVDEADARQQVKIPIPRKPDIQRNLNQAKGDDRRGVDGLAPWWHEVSTYSFQSAMADADQAWSNWLASLAGKRAGARVGYPRFKKKGRSRDSVRLHHDVNHPTIRLDGYRRLVMPRIGSVRLHSTAKRLTRAMDRTGGVITSVTVSRAGTRWYASILVRTPATNPAQPTRRQQAAGTVGVDVGVTRLATLSTGLDDSYPNPRHLAAAQRKLTKAQRALARTQKGSGRRERAKLRVARIHHKVAEQRAGAIHQLTKQLATRHAGVAIEDLRVKNMTRSARGTVDKPGTRVRQKAGLNRAVLDGAFGEIRRQLEYKTAWYGSTLYVVNPAGTSKTCSACGTAKPTLTLAERTYRCDTCGLVMDRDLNAAINIAARAAVPAVNVADDTSETQNGRRGHVRPPHPGAAAVSETARPDPLGPPRRSNPAALPHSA